MSLLPARMTRKEHADRLSQYAISIAQLKRVLPKRNWDVVFCDNTVSDFGKLPNHSLRQLLNGERIVQVGANLGEDNKGVGELDMLAAALKATEIGRYSTVSYFTGRHILTCPYVFERTEAMQAEALLSNPDFLYLDGTFSESYKVKMYNDMFFSMKPDVITRYSLFAQGNREMMLNQSFGSEQLLYKFVHEQRVSFEWLDSIGLIRTHSARPGVKKKQVWHVC
jgi:hypothetical protein